MRRVTYLFLTLAAGCHASAAPAPGGSAGTPVTVAAVQRADLRVILEVPARTEALSKVRVTAPFAGTLTSLSVVEGDRVRQGQEIGALIARDSEASLNGAREMLRQARTDAEKRDAERAVALAEAARVRAPLVAPSAGVVLTRGASQGDLVTEGQELVSIAGAGSIGLEADVPQNELARIRPGEKADVQLAAGPLIAATVHGILPSADSSGFTAKVRLDPKDLAAPTGQGLFGTAKIIVDEHKGVLAVPVGAVLRDDVSGVSRIAIVTNEGIAHWVDVTVGATDRGLVEIASGLAAEDRVIVSGHVGLPEGAPLAIEK
jgi:multidrug efflux pump subunit AcrA (membrane-fusion protein)